MDEIYENKEDWLTSIYNTFGSLLFGYIRTIAKDQHYAEDIMQNVFIKLSKTNPASISNVKSYIFTVARNESFTFINKKKKKIKSLSLSTPILSPASEEISSLESMCIEEAISSLPEDQKEVVYLKIYAQLTLKKIADTLNISINTVASRYRYAMEKLQKQLGDENEQ